MNFARAYCESTAQSGPLRFVASTEGLARDGKVLTLANWRLENYRRNPVVMFAHRYDQPPIGRAAVNVDYGRRALLADVTFDDADDFARRVESKYRRGFLHAVSVGWDERQEGGQTVYDLLDISAVPVPADPAALAEGRARGLAALERWLYEGDAVARECAELARFWRRAVVELRATIRR
jgi:hypothetical protein